MRQRGLSYEQVGEALSVDPTTVRKWEKRGFSRVVSYALQFSFRLREFGSRAPWWTDVAADKLKDRVVRSPEHVDQNR